ncbi:diacylglycerol kinase (ATP) [Amycolatopsis arida]|uniref:Diacylglycerol kinase (ATP) n=1 Tax=Amycolatopsis arida TaxID=587909 RepID=A0A1I5ZGQ0_9PSEU|nr:diacylglycerol kinase family protein [Amycolatopsis arida]TDX89663.1 diacylglycerol kinase (ATP) [Amycolatopsis arida]SFQ55590.1 diacylglycerol kinase (ATP) [Amycolatopsis arida]
MGVHAALAVHPDSGRGAAARIAGTVADRLRAGVDRLDLLVANTVAESRELMAGAHADGLDVLVVLGGDGAAHQAVQFCAATGVTLGLVPSGTGNDLARALNVPADPLTAVDAAVDALRHGRRRRIDLGQVGGSWFGTVLCAGFDACVTERANRLRWPAGPRRYDVAILAELAGFRARPVVVHTAGDRLELDATLVAAGNTAWYGGGVPICPDAQADDGLLDVTVVGRASRRELLRMLPSLRGGRHVDHPAVRTLRARELHLVGPDWPVFADGEPLGRLPSTVRCVPGALTVLG